MSYPRRPSLIRTITRALFEVLMLLAGLLALFMMLHFLFDVPQAHSQPPAGTDPDLREWFRAQVQPDSGITCCDIGDGHILGEGDWREGAAGPEIKVGGHWLAVPPEKILRGIDNPTGGAVAWYGPHGVPIFCFSRPAET